MKKYYCHTCKYYSAAKDLKYKNHVNEEGDPLIEVKNLPYGKCRLNPPTVTSVGSMWPKVNGASDYCSHHYLVSN